MVTSSNLEKSVSASPLTPSPQETPAAVTQSLQLLVIGRQSTTSHPDIAVPPDQDTVGRSHAELTVSDSGACYIVDLDSANGTFLKEAGKWKRIKQAALDLGSEIRLGEYRTTPALLLSMRSVRTSPRQQTPPQIQPPKTEPRAHGAKPRRNPITGEVE